MKIQNICICTSFFRLVDGGWKLEEDRLHFELILEQYPRGVNGYRTLYIDRMLREMSHKTRDDIVSPYNLYIYCYFIPSLTGGL